MKHHLFPYNWTLENAQFKKNRGTVFSCFSCGGGSTMGYKLAGFDVIGCNEIDLKLMDTYIENHNLKYSFLESITTFKARKDLSKELYKLDILDGSPPCSSFSTVGSREKGWGKKKKFREGQTEQILDTLFFDFIDLAKELQPRIVVAENVKGLLIGNAKKYVRQIYKEFDDAGYYCQHFLLNAATMGVPQKRERVFFICLRKDLARPFLYQKDMFTSIPKIDLAFNEPPIPFKDIEADEKEPILRHPSPCYKPYWELCKPGENCKKYHPKGSLFSGYKIDPNKPLLTITTKSVDAGGLHYTDYRILKRSEIYKASTFPQDYKTTNPSYICGMSVPPVMTAQIANQIYLQWLVNII